MLKIWTITSIGNSGTPYLVPGNTLLIANGAAQDLDKLWKTGSVLDLDNQAPGEAFSIERGSAWYEGACIEFPSPMILRKVIVISQYS